MIVFFTGLILWAAFWPGLRRPEGGVQFFAVLTALMSFFTAIQVRLDKGYRIAFDDEAIYLREHALIYGDDRLMRYDDIGEIITDATPLNIKPFGLIHFHRKDWDGKERYFVSRFQLFPHEIIHFLKFLYTKCPEKFPDDLVEFMNDGASRISEIY